MLISSFLFCSLHSEIAGAFSARPAQAGVMGQLLGWGVPLREAAANAAAEGSEHALLCSYGSATW